MRADAVKNRARILQAAEEIFATEGVSVPIDTVAERRGSVGTLYRHFPTKEACSRPSWWPAWSSF